MSAVEMKDSGVEWLGEIPAHWQSMSLSDVADVLAGQSPASSSYNDEGLGLPFFQGKAEFGSRFPTVANWCTEPEQISESGDILISVRAPVGDVNVAPYECCIGRGLAAIRANGRSHNIFLYYLLIHTKSPLESEGTGSTFKSIDKTILRRVAVPLPPIHEQRAIAAYLDRETAKIDALINKTDALNVLLREKRVALISRAVTKGLDAGVEMKDSGVEWLGEIPRGWEVKPLYALTLSTEKRDPSQEPDTEFRYIDVSSISSERNQISAFEELMGYDAPTRARNVVFEGDTIFATVRPYLRNIALIPIELHYSICSTGYCVLRPERIKLKSRFLFFSCISAGFVASVEAHQQGVSYPAVSDRVVRGQVIPLPPLAEQRAIADHLDRETAKIDALISKNDELIALLREKRSALISAAVTGKISVSPIK